MIWKCELPLLIDNILHCDSMNGWISVLSLSTIPSVIDVFGHCGYGSFLTHSKLLFKALLHLQMLISHSISSKNCLLRLSQIFVFFCKKFNNNALVLASMHFYFTHTCIMNYTAYWLLNNNRELVFVHVHQPVLPTLALVTFIWSSNQITI